jgi:hypothetical protein
LAELPAPMLPVSASTFQGASWPIMLLQQPGLALHVRSPARLPACSARSRLCFSGATSPAATAAVLWP